MLSCEVVKEIPVVSTVSRERQRTDQTRKPFLPLNFNQNIKEKEIFSTHPEISFKNVLCQAVESILYSEDSHLAHYVTASQFVPQPWWTDE